MLRRSLTLLGLGLLTATLWLAPASSARADDVMRMYHYPYYYFPHNYYPNQVTWPDYRQKFQLPPAYMAYPPFHDPTFRYEMWTNHRYYRGFHFWLDQF